MGWNYEVGPLRGDKVRGQSFYKWDWGLEDRPWRAAFPLSCGTIARRCHHQVRYGPSLNTGSTSTFNMDFSASRIVKKWVASVYKPPVLWHSVLPARWRLHWVVSPWVPWVQSAELPSSITWCQLRSHGWDPEALGVTYVRIIGMHWTDHPRDIWNEAHMELEATQATPHNVDLCKVHWKEQAEKSAYKWHSASWHVFPHKTWENFKKKKGFKHTKMKPNMSS